MGFLNLRRPVTRHELRVTSHESPVTNKSANRPPTWLAQLIPSSKPSYHQPPRYHFPVGDDAVEDHAGGGGWQLHFMDAPVLP